MKSVPPCGIESQYLFSLYRNIFGVTAILFLNSFSPSVMATEIDNELFAQNTRRFSLDLFAAIDNEKPNSNLIFSPFSIQTCLAMAFAGAKDKTAEEMRKGLHLISNDRQVVGESFQNVLHNYQDNDVLKIANKFYLKTGYEVTPAFNEIAIKDFYSEAQNLDFSKNTQAAQTMNSWVEDKTHGKIRNLISADSLNDDTRMVLLNAIYFKAAWINQFNKDLTKKEDFWLNDEKKIDVDMMNMAKAKFMFGDFPELDATALEMPYRSGFSMFIILPKTKTGLKILETKLKTVDLLDLKARMSRCEVTVKLPKFKVSFEIKLKKTLTSMGMGTMFTKAANFSNLINSKEPLEVSEVVHKAYIEVNEEGSEAAAATAAIARMKRSLSFPVTPKEFIADHPLFYAIMNNQPNNLLFCGFLRLLTDLNNHDEL